jgi:hypothetical protein
VCPWEGLTDATGWLATPSSAVKRVRKRAILQQMAQCWAHRCRGHKLLSLLNKSGQIIARQLQVFGWLPLLPEVDVSQ